MAQDDDHFHKLFDPIVDMANETTSRGPLTDLFDTQSANYAQGTAFFVARPVVFAKVLFAAKGSGTARNERALGGVGRENWMMPL